MNRATIVLVILLLLASFAGGYYYRGERTIIQRDTTTVTRYDTIKIREPFPVVEYILDTITVRESDIIFVGDTLKLPRTQKVYQDSTYMAKVSGYMPKLDYIEVYQKTTTNTINHYIEPRKWGIGVIGGVGVTNKGLSPFIGVGLYYRVF